MPIDVTRDPGRDPFPTWTPGGRASLSYRIATEDPISIPGTSSPEARICAHFVSVAFAPGAAIPGKKVTPRGTPPRRTVVAGRASPHPPFGPLLPGTEKGTVVALARRDERRRWPSDRLRPAAAGKGV